MDGRYNTRSPAVKRLMREAQELSEPTDQYFAQPLDDNLFEWHFTIRGPADSDFQNGIYHGRIILPVDYPMKPPSIIWLTPNGRFETSKKICLSISGHHPESWQPSWSIRTALLAIIGFMPTHPGGAIGSLDYTPEERKVLAKKSKDWKCPTCGEIKGILLDVSSSTQTTSNEAKELAAQINLQGEKPKCKDGECPVEQTKVSEVAKNATSSGTVPEIGASQVENGGAVGVGENATNNTSTPMQQGPSLPSATNQPTIPPFPHWSPLANAFPMPPVGFPFQYPGMPPMQFPYPPSYYPATPQYTWQAGMPSGTFPPLSISINNSSNQDNIKGEDISSHKNDQYSRTPMSCTVTNNGSQALTSSDNASNVEYLVNPQRENDTVKINKGQVFKELLSKVNRVGSSTENRHSNNETLVATTLGPQEQSGSGVPGTPSILKRSELAGKRQKTEEGTDSELSTKSMKKTGGKSISEIGDTNTEENSESDVPPIEVDKIPLLEKGACSSTSDLERWKQRYQMTKGLRQRQSATAAATTTSTVNSPPDLTEEGASNEPERSETSAARQRIEAVSGDTGSRNRSRHAARLGNNAVLGNRAENIRLNRQGSYDVGFYLMVGLFTTSMLILFNRLVQIDWSGL